jgi:PAS domain S-box-containing protein
VDEAVISLTPAVSGVSADPAAILVSPPAFLDLLPIAAYACDATGRLRWFNRRAAELWGRSPRIGDATERFCGSYKLYALDGRLIRREETPMANVLRTGNPVSGAESAVERPDGTRIVTMVHVNPLKDVAGNIIGAINCFHDVTDAKHEDRRLRESERQFRDLLQALPAAIYTTDRAGRITDGPGFELAETLRRSSGLGLVIGLVGQIGGSFRVERAPGARCTVEFQDENSY